MSLDFGEKEDSDDDVVDGNDGVNEAFEFASNYGDDDEVASDYGDDDEYIDEDDDDDYLKLQAQFDNVDLPPGVEATVTWLPDLSPTEEKPSVLGPSTSRQVDKISGARSSKAESSLEIIKEETTDDVLRKLMYFKQFDTVPDFTDHHYINKLSGRQMVHYHSSGFRLNPNLYESGKVCLSLLNTWQGKNNEMWQPEKSTMLQILVSIQALILNTQLFFNEPDYEKSFQGPEGKKRSREYSEDIFVKSLKKMMYTMRNPPQHFEDLVAGHFRIRAVDIMTACQAYAEGADVACYMKKWHEEEGNKAALKLASKNFKAEVVKMMKPLLKYFINNGSKDLGMFQNEDA